MSTQITYNLETLIAAAGEEVTIKNYARGLPAVFCTADDGALVFMGYVTPDCVYFDNKRVNMEARDILERLGVPYHRW